jgi:putative Holliday junction resolvase
MKILGIDYGQKKIGLALAEGRLAEPYKVIRYQDPGRLLREIKEIVKRERIEKVVVGISEGKMGQETKSFAQRLGAATFDETLSTQRAQELSRLAVMKKKKRKALEDAFAAAVMLQSYLNYV